LSVGLAGALAVASLGALGCSSSDTILALTVSSASDVLVVSKLRVTIKAEPPATFPDIPPQEIVPQTMPPADAGPPVIKSSFFTRLTLPENTDGPATVVVEALDASGMSFAGGRGTANIEKHHVVAAQVMLTVGGPPPPDAGAGGTGAGEGGHGGEAGAAGGHGGEAGGHGGEAGGAGGEAGAGGAAGRRGNNGGGNRGGAGGLGIGGLGGI